MRWASEAVFSARLTLEMLSITKLSISVGSIFTLKENAAFLWSAACAASRNSERRQLRESCDHQTQAVTALSSLALAASSLGRASIFSSRRRRGYSVRQEAKRFVSYGSALGFLPEREFAYSVYLRDHLRRAGIEDRVTLLSATPEIEFAYELSNVLLLPSRLDPLPNVAIDAMCQGLPVLCFEKASGIAELLCTAGLKDACVAEYINTSELAEKILRLASSLVFYSEVSLKMRDFAAATFDFDRYVQRVEALGENAKARADNADTDVADIIASGCFRPDFFNAATDRAFGTTKSVSSYVNRPNSVATPRKPEPGFNPFVYAERQESGYDGTSEAYADFLRKGRPKGPWLLPVLEGGLEETKAAPAASLKTALHVHAYFTDQLQEILIRLQRNRTQPDLFFSVGSRNSVDEVRAIFSDYRGRVVAVQEVANAGRDIGPLLTEFGSTLAKEYDIVGHAHVKKSLHIGNRVMLRAWCDFLFENLLGGTRGGRMMDLALHQMQTDDKIGLVYPDDPNVFGWMSNRRIAKRLAKRIGHADLPSAINFPVGTMFWMRAAALKPFIDLGLDWSDYPSEPLPEDGTILHALERLFGVVPVLDGWGSVVSNIRGVTR